MRWLWLLIYDIWRLWVSLCNLCVLCVSVVCFCSEFINHRDTENTEVAQRRRLSWLFVQSQNLSANFLLVLWIVAPQPIVPPAQTILLKNAARDYLSARSGSALRRHNKRCRVPGMTSQRGRNSRMICFRKRDTRRWAVVNFQRRGIHNPHRTTFQLPLWRKCWRKRKPDNLFW